MHQAIELNLKFLQMKIRAEAEDLLPYEEFIAGLKESGEGDMVLQPELLQKIRNLLRLKHELKQDQCLAATINRN
jgi:hypothetical protein